jgi:sugar phosphate isomerase/epimerase
MSNVSRRGFLAGGAGLAGAALLPGAAGAPALAADAAVDRTLVGGLLPPERIGLQLYSVDDEIKRIGFARVLEALATMGYKQVEFAGYTDNTKITLKELRAQLDANGLTAIGSHVSPTSDDLMKQILEEAAVLGIPNVGISFPLPATGPTAFGWRQLSAEYNRYGELAAKSGVGFYLHNHFHEWLPCPDDLTRRGQDVLLQETDPRYVFFELDIYWAYVGQAQSGTILKFDPLKDYAIKYRDRFKLFHVKDGKSPFAVPLVNMCDAGQGGIDFQAFFNTLFAQSASQVDKHWYIWERDNATEHPRGSMASARASYTFIRYGLTGPHAPVHENSVPAAVVGASVRRTKTGRQIVRAAVESDVTVSVTVRASRRGRTLARMRVMALATGRRAVELRLPRGTAGGPAQLEVVLTGPDGTAHKTRLTVVVPASA